MSTRDSSSLAFSANSILVCRPASSWASRRSTRHSRVRCRQVRPPRPTRAMMARAAGQGGRRPLLSASLTITVGWAATSTGLSYPSRALTTITTPAGCHHAHHAAVTTAPHAHTHSLTAAAELHKRTRLNTARHDHPLSPSEHN
ncbi:hypothetical protein Pcinc_037425 [Petrolisthes cinctipes]|uniref:Uncharacterized protein n=1 Tax=Petrolisthes cinctipes TaxID=88211 RepID=A0AAE1ELJ5_PETCI|nr:hypothetical protein Pcinc_037425 [Petrolisthes cinctipes]